MAAPVRVRPRAEIIACLTSAVAAQSELKRGNNVLVVDDYALSIIHASVGLTEILKAGFLTVSPFETKKELADDKRRRKHEALDVLYYMRPKKSNLQRVMDDYKQDVSGRRTGPRGACPGGGVCAPWHREGGCSYPLHTHGLQAGLRVRSWRAGGRPRA
jgi:hypothetical protein